MTHQELKVALNRFGVELAPQEFAEVIQKVPPPLPLPSLVRRVQIILTEVCRSLVGVSCRRIRWAMAT